MAGFAKAILVSLLVTVAFLIFSNFIFFFPWYMTMMYETFHLSLASAQNNYLQKSEIAAIRSKLEKQPGFKDYKDDLVISCTRIGDHEPEYYKDKPDSEKPYKQRGEQIEVSIKAVYPFKLKIAGTEKKIPLEMNFSLKTTGLRYYKDLEQGIYDGDIDDGVIIDPSVPGSDPYATEVPVPTVTPPAIDPGLVETPTPSSEPSATPTAGIPIPAGP
ncbi:MAG: hypothetical protein N2645_15010 [Clostridia bacterium]|nr:hypothetical protein [Clostridia bacterium]